MPNVTCAIWGATHISGQHLHCSCALALLAQAVQDLCVHPLLHLQQLLLAEAELRQCLGNLTCLISQSIGPGCYQGSTFATPTL